MLNVSTGSPCAQFSVSVSNGAKTWNGSPLNVEDYDSELIPVSQRHTATPSVNAPADTTVGFVCDVFEIDGNFGTLAEAKGAPDPHQTVSGDGSEKRHGGVVTDDCDAVDGGSDRKQSVLYLCECFPGGNQ